jgi:hypothetical protein
VSVFPDRWFGATGRKVPAIALEGTIDVDGALVVDSVADLGALQEAHDTGIPIVVRATTVEEVKAALARPEVACTLVSSEDLLGLDLRKLTYG